VTSLCAATPAFCLIPGSALLERRLKYCAGQSVEGGLAWFAVSGREQGCIQWWVTARSDGGSGGLGYAGDGVVQRRGWLAEPKFVSPASACLGVGCQSLDARGREGQRYGHRFRP
jgi:hypothetical protein